MLKVMIVGRGKMGSLLTKSAEIKGMEVLGNFVKKNFSEAANLNPDVVIDFSHQDNLECVLGFVKEKHCALVYGTTGLDENQIQALEDTSKVVPVFYSANFSYGIAVFEQILKQFADRLKENFDMEVVEIHHNQKQDAPSGTAKMLVDACDSSHEYERVYGRQGFTGKRKKEIGIHSLRGGSVAGEHSVYFFGEDETLEIKHSASSRQIFVNGALKAADFIVKQDAGFYTMEDMM